MSIFRILYLMAGTATALCTIFVIAGWQMSRLDVIIFCAGSSIAWFGLDWYEHEELKAKAGEARHAIPKHPPMHSKEVGK
jgi:hypothetical protein